MLWIRSSVMSVGIVFLGLLAGAAIVAAADNPAGTSKEAQPASAKAQARSGGPSAPVKAPEVTGAWTGEWGPYDPASSSGPAKEKCKAIDCVVELKEGVWHATFEGECGRPYKYKIDMDGRQAGGAVLFKGTTDLGEQDGGVFDWVGRATDDGFVGFYTSAHYTGVFTLKTRAEAKVSRSRFHARRISALVRGTSTAPRWPSPWQRLK